jgi:hypothetical protein
LPSARVGTVDKFRGQEAPIAIYAMLGTDGVAANQKYLISAGGCGVGTRFGR